MKRGLRPPRIIQINWDGISIIFQMITRKSCRKATKENKSGTTGITQKI
jgi:hypothetical protein